MSEVPVIIEDDDSYWGRKMGNMHYELPQKNPPSLSDKPSSPSPNFKIKGWTEEDEMNYEMSIIFNDIHGEVPLPQG